MAMPPLGAVVCIAMFTARVGTGDWRTPTIAAVLLVAVLALHLFLRSHLSASDESGGWWRGDEVFVGGGTRRRNTLDIMD